MLQTGGTVRLFIAALLAGCNGPILTEECGRIIGLTEGCDKVVDLCYVLATPRNAFGTPNEGKQEVTGAYLSVDHGARDFPCYNWDDEVAVREGRVCEDATERAFDYAGCYTSPW